MPETLEYPYRPRPGTMLAATGFFGLCALIGVRAAATNDRPLLIEGLIELDTPNATRLEWGLVVVAIAFVAAGLYGLWVGMTRTTQLRLTAGSLEAPRNGFSRTIVTMPLAEVQNVGLMTVKKQAFMTVATRSGRVTIARSMLPSEEAFDTLHRELVERVTAARGQG